MSSTEISPAGDVDEQRADLGGIRIDVEGVSEAEVRVDGEERGTVRSDVSVLVQVDPGEHVVSATAEGAATVRRTIEVRPGEVEEVVLGLATRAPVEVAAETPAEPRERAVEESLTEPASSGGGLSPWLWVAGGALVVGAAVVVTVLLVGGGDGGAPESPFPVAETLTWP